MVTNDPEIIELPDDPTPTQSAVADQATEAQTGTDPVAAGEPSYFVGDLIRIGDHTFRIRKKTNRGDLVLRRMPAIEQLPHGAAVLTPAKSRAERRFQASAFGSKRKARAARQAWRDAQRLAAAAAALQAPDEGLIITKVDEP